LIPWTLASVSIGAFVAPQCVGEDHPQVDATLHKCVHEVDHVPRVPAKAFRPTDNQRIAVTDGLEAGFKALTVFLFAARCVAVNFGNASCDEGIALPVKHLQTVSCRDTHVAEEERSMTLFQRRFLAHLVSLFLC